MAADTRICNIGYWKHGSWIYTKIARLLVQWSFPQIFCCLPVVRCVSLSLLSPSLVVSEFFSRHNNVTMRFEKLRTWKMIVEPVQSLWNCFSKCVDTMIYTFFFSKCVKCLDNNNCLCTFITHIEILLVPNDSHFVF